jgi:hypothetical protein
MAPKISPNVSSTFFIVFEYSENPLAGQAASGFTRQQMSHNYLKMVIVTFSAVVSWPFNLSDNFGALKVPEKLIDLLSKAT